MAETQRFRFGQQKTTIGLIQAGVKAQVGDLMMQVGNYAVPANLLSVNGSGSGSGEGFSGGSGFTDFKSVFLGVLIEGATGGAETSDTSCVVGVDGVYEFNLPVAATQVWPVGTPMEPVIVSSAIAPDQLQPVSGRTYAVALVARNINTGDLGGYVTIFSSIMGEPLT